MKIEFLEDRAVITDLEYFDAFQTFTCGQCFRFHETVSLGARVFEGVAFGKYLKVSQKKDSLTVFFEKKEDFDLYWMKFLGLDEDYGSIRETMKGLGGEYLDNAMESGRGIRILRQDPWEALCSFIISQNNNIPRITSLVSALCERYGQKKQAVIDGKDVEYYSFPTATELFENASVQGLQNLKMGFRAKYIADAAEKVAKGIIDLELVREMTPDDAMAVLMTISGVGPKVASCALLYGLYFTDLFPIDVWMKRIIDTRYAGALDYKALGNYAGLAQQYMFYHERTVES